jgi:D-amino-acid dehydrogenase
VVVIGAGMVGLSTAWFLQERGVDVVVVDRATVAAGSSGGNAGWISPGLATPLTAPSNLRYGLRSMWAKDSAVRIPLTADPALWRFLFGFARRCTARSWRRGMDGYLPINQLAIGAYDELADGGVKAPTYQAPITAAFRRQSEAAAIVDEFEHARAHGLDLQIQTVSGAEMRAQLPFLADGIRTAVKLSGQRFLNPGEYLASLADSIIGRGGELRNGSTVRTIRPNGGRFLVELWGGEPVRGDAVVIATGAWLPDLAGRYGVRIPLVAGRGYSFNVPSVNRIEGPLYFPTQRIACTPMSGRLRVAGVMEFRDVDAPVDFRQTDAMVRSGRTLLAGVDWDDRQDVWAGGRPVTADGLPIVGVTRTPGIYVVGGHGMHGIGLGPATGRLLAEQIVTRRIPAALRPFDPLR